jgi:hypothetical protein
MGWNRGADRGDRCEFLIDIGFLGGPPHEGAELRRELALDGGAPVGLDLRRTGSLLQRRLEAFHARVVGGSGNARAGDANDVGLDHHIVGAADEKEMLDVVTAQKKKLPLPVEIVDIDDAEARLTAAAAAIAARHHQTGARQLAEDYTEEHEQDQNDRECNRELDCP